MTSQDKVGLVPSKNICFAKGVEGGSDIKRALVAILAVLAGCSRQPKAAPSREDGWTILTYSLEYDQGSYVKITLKHGRAIYTATCAFQMFESNAMNNNCHVAAALVGQTIPHCEYRKGGLTKELPCIVAPSGYAALSVFTADEKNGVLFDVERAKSIQ